jgi:hypothetical protein
MGVVWTERSEILGTAVKTAGRSGFRYAQSGLQDDKDQMRG